MEYRQPIPTTLSPYDLLLSFYGGLENSDDGFLVVSPDGNIAYINEAYCNYINVDRDEVLGKPVLDYIDTSLMPSFRADLTIEPQVGVLHKVSAQQYRDGEHYSIVNRTNISEAGRSISGIGQVKFVRSTLKLSAAINEVYEELSHYKSELSRLSAERYSFDRILGDSEQMQAAKELAKRTTGNNFPVLITGETGTGKEVFASAIHYASTRKNKPFVRVNCAAIPAELLESELFGYAEGSFTGARKGGKKGKFELANGGTLFLDEIGDMPLVMQAKILRALQEGEIERVGGEMPTPVDVRIIAATNKDLAHEVSEKRFRADLYFRLNVISIQLPPLRSRTSDIDLYIDAFLAKLNGQYHTDVHITPEARKTLNQYSWPGNVRELKNIIERCFVLQEGGIISSILIPHNIRKTSTAAFSTDHGTQDLATIMDSVEREVLISTIQRYQGNLSAAAKELGIHRVTLYKKLEKHGLSREDCS